MEAQAIPRNSKVTQAVPGFHAALMAARARAFNEEHAKAQRLALRTTALLVRAQPTTERAAASARALPAAEQCRVAPLQPLNHSAMLCAIEDAVRAASIKASLVYGRAEGSYHPTTERSTAASANELQAAAASHLAGLAAFSSPHKAVARSPLAVHSGGGSPVTGPPSAAAASSAKRKKKKKR